MTVRSAVNTRDNPAVGKSPVGDVKSTTSKIRTQLYGLVQPASELLTVTNDQGSVWMLGNYIV